MLASIRHALGPCQQSGNHYVPAPHMMNWKFVEEKLGLKAFYAHVKAMHKGQRYKTENE